MLGWSLFAFLSFLTLAVLNILMLLRRGTAIDFFAGCWAAIAIGHGVSFGILLRAWQRVVRMGWQLRSSHMLWRGMGLHFRKLRLAVPRDEFAMTPSWRSGQSELYNLRTCINLRLDLEKERIRHGVVDLALTWAEARSAAGDPEFYEFQPETASPGNSNSEPVQSGADDRSAHPEGFPTDAEPESIEPEDSSRDAGAHP